MKVTDDDVEQLYEAAKSGHWVEVLAAFADDGQLAGRCSRYSKPSSGWTFLHQAAFFGNEGAVRALIKLGASLARKSKEGETPADIARKRGHVELSKLMETAAESGTHLWEPSPDPELLHQRAPDPLLQRKLLYNAVTRAKRRAVILVQGSEKKLAKDPVLGLIWTPPLATPRKPKRRAGR